jgi:hypothetical protein
VPISGATVSLYAATTSTGTYSVVRSLTTSSSGSVSLAVKPSVNRFYKWEFSQDSIHASITSATSKVSVAQVVSVHAVTVKVKRGATVTLWGLVSPNETNQYVYLQSYYSGAWHTNTMVTDKLVSQKLPDGTTRVGYLLKFPAQYTQYRVLRGTTSANAAGYSAIVTITFI